MLRTRVKISAKLPISVLGIVKLRTRVSNLSPSHVGMDINTLLCPSNLHHLSHVGVSLGVGETLIIHICPKRLAFSVPLRLGGGESESSYGTIVLVPLMLTP